MKDIWFEVLRYCSVPSILAFASTCAKNFHLSYHSAAVLSSWRPRSWEEIRSVINTRALQVVDVSLLEDDDGESSNFEEFSGEDLVLFSRAMNLRSFVHEGELYTVPDAIADAFLTLLRCLPRLSELVLKGSFLSRVLIRTTLPANISKLSLEDCQVRSWAYNDRQMTTVPDFPDTSVLVSLDLSSNEEIRESSFLIRLKGCSRLTSLNLSGCRNLSSFGLLDIASALPSITSLGLAHMHFDADAPSLLSAFAQLRSLDLSYSSFSHTFSPAEIPPLSSLLSLRLRGCKGIHPEIVDYVSSHIVHLDLIDTSFHTDLALRDPLCSVTFPHLRFVDLKVAGPSCPSDAVSEILSFTARCPSLVTLQVLGVNREKERLKLRNGLPSSLICKFLVS
eukprot:GILK01011177.1.p1 GENE.GILK01011177.1~~GILK01011177.1.p1  ORF type:complete len:393 (+),score=38.19 GILK01011177.1:121-1299(+)